jgi:hypothetical protein
LTERRRDDSDHVVAVAAEQSFVDFLLAGDAQGRNQKTEEKF